MSFRLRVEDGVIEILEADTMKIWQEMIVLPDIKKTDMKYLGVDLPSSATSGRVNFLGSESVLTTTVYPSVPTTVALAPTTATSCKTSGQCETIGKFCAKTEFNIESVCIPCPESNACPWELTAGGAKPEDPEWRDNFRLNFECEQACRSSPIHQIHYFQVRIHMDMGRRGMSPRG